MAAAPLAASGLHFI